MSAILSIAKFCCLEYINQTGQITLRYAGFLGEDDCFIGGIEFHKVHHCKQ